MENTQESQKSIVIVNTLMCASIEGTEANIVEVEGSLTKGLPNFSVVGLAGSDIQESKERAKNALQAEGYELPPLKITINLSPSEVKKSGTHFDLSIAILVALGEIEILHKNIFVFGELGLDGRVKNSSLIFPLILSLKEQGLIKNAIVPKEAMESLKFIKGVNFYSVNTLQEAIELLSAKELPKEPINTTKYKAKELKIDNQVYYYIDNYREDFSEIKGQELAIRAALISAAGMHNMLLNGNPGSGKSMIAKRMQYILPPLNESEILAIARHQFLDNQNPNFEPLRPFRSPHHTATSAAIFGGGSHQAKIGEVALASSGILFFDELPHFSSKVLEALREPLQDRIVNIARVNSKVSYSANFVFIGAMNPCPCGNLLSKTKECRCTDLEIKRYKNRLSDPFLDRIELYVTMQEVDLKKENTTSSAKLHQAVIKAFIAQKNRGQSKLNGDLQESEIDKYCILEAEAKAVLEQAITKFGLSYRSIANIKKVSRTISDLNDNKNITKKDIFEALSYRKRS